MRQQELEKEIALLKAQPTPEQAIAAYTHWLFNADSNFIEQVWKYDPRMANHFQTKLNEMIRRNGINTGFLNCMTVEILAHFDRELSENYRADLYRYIIEHHLNKW